MENIYAAMLLHKAGKEITEESLTAVLAAASVNVDPVRVKALLASLSEVNIEEVIKSAREMTTAQAVPVATIEPAKTKAKEEKKPEKKEEKEPEIEGLGALFG